jgi:antitoxin StbD
VAILNRNEPAFYCVPAKAFKALMEKLEDLRKQRDTHLLT